MTMISKARCPIMHHLPSEVTYASKFFPGYLTEDEMQERQFTGRYWYVSYNNEGFIISNRPVLFIILDNETVLTAHYDEDDDIVEGVYDKANSLVYIPDSLRGIYYAD